MAKRMMETEDIDEGEEEDTGESLAVVEGEVREEVALSVKGDAAVVEEYKVNRAEKFAGSQARLMVAADYILGKMTKAKLGRLKPNDSIKRLRDIYGMIAQLHERERLERGESTENVAVVVKAIKEIKAKRAGMRGDGE